MRATVGTMRRKKQLPINRKLYPPDWEEISHRIRFICAGGKCEGCERYPDCRAEHGQPHPVTGSMVILTTAHWPDPSPANNDEGNLHAWCQRCHNTMDAAMRLYNRRRNYRARQRAAGQMEMAFKRERRRA